MGEEEMDERRKDDAALSALPPDALDSTSLTSSCSIDNNLNMSAAFRCLWPCRLCHGNTFFRINISRFLLILQKVGDEMHFLWMVFDGFERAS